MENPIVVSACLLGALCRYDGRRRASRGALARAAGRRILAVCPERLGGLPVPRPPAEIVSGGGRDVLAGAARIRSAGGEDVTEAFVRGAEEVVRLARTFGAREAWLKARSPSCGEDGVAAAALARAGLHLQMFEFDDA